MKLDDLKRIVEAATPGPWRTHEPIPHTYSQQILTYDGGILAETTCYGKMRDDAAFIAASRTLLPKLLAVADLAWALINQNFEGEPEEILDQIHGASKPLAAAIAALESTDE